MTKFFVDFNALNPDGVIIASSQFQVGSAQIGDRVATQDHEGNSCEGEVLNIEDSWIPGIKLVTIKLNLETWKDPCSIPDS